MAKSEPKLTQVTIRHDGGGAVSIRKYDEKSTYTFSESRTFAFDPDWTEAEIEDYVEEKRQALRARVDAIAQAEHEERFDASFMAGTK